MTDTSKAKATVNAFLDAMGVDEPRKAQVILAALTPAALDLIRLVDECRALIRAQNLDEQSSFTKLRQSLIGIQALREILDDILGVEQIH